MAMTPTWVAARNASRSARDMVRFDMSSPPTASPSRSVNRGARPLGVLGGENGPMAVHGCIAYGKRIMTDDANVIVIGGGIVGLSTAMALVQGTPALRPIVLEKEATLAAHQTGHNSGVIH